MKETIFLSKALKALCGCIFLTLACSCEKEKTYSIGSNINQPAVITSGSAYIQCEIGPFYISHEDLGTCNTEFGFDSLLSEDWVQGCSMSELMVDSLMADIRMTYLEDGELEILGLASELNAQPFELVVSNDTIDVNEPSFFGSTTYELDGRTYYFVIVNRYIGGCFHDELIWEISE